MIIVYRDEGIEYIEVVIDYSVAGDRLFQMKAELHEVLKRGYRIVSVMMINEARHYILEKVFSCR